MHEGDIAYLQSSLLEKSGLVDHAFSTRIGGCSKGPYYSLNMAFHTGDNVNNVMQNRRRFFNLFDYDFRSQVSAVQVHGVESAVFNEKSRGEGACPGTVVKHCDALITAVPGLPLTAYSADCQLIYFVSLEKPLVALAHAGWRGALGGIGAGLIERLQKEFLLDPGELLVALSPAICRDCYLINKKIARLFQDAGYSDPSYLEPVSDGFYKLDLTSVNEAQLLRAGIKKENLAKNSWCSSCIGDLFYSYRRDHGITGRMIGFIAIRREKR
ncbi:MAG: polyphenol oxidase family protein [Bacillota bacterium]|nr:polyphenol oxidase family protein [Bacillota bacterium]